MADSWRKGSGFLKSTQRFSNKKTAGKLALYIFLFYENVIGWIKFATLLPNNWLAETPQALVPRRLGRLSAERERISEIKQKHLLRAVSEKFF
ncbi:hypothetical protein [Peribacillus frigoritolerans]|uniref:hypothetical protein n=1 Tax=Peribacillus frigoritolerans TaxID=450367 RepID=UPI0024C16067|nr:hypothetical protein [Peribacillus frigoritolerans]MDM5310494.1 hypothetical protein [Peribacillus frigoritolerans]WHX63109.1 hypothetical protein QNH33_05890 [Peribacillus frigoritolerans]